MIATEQGVKFLGNQLAVRVQLPQETVRICVIHGARNPFQIVVACGQNMGLLIVEVLNAVLNIAQECVGLCKLLCGFLRHEVGTCQALQCLQRGAAAQFRKLPAAYHLQQLDREFNFTDAAP